MNETAEGVLQNHNAFRRTALNWEPERIKLEMSVRKVDEEAQDKKDQRIIMRRHFHCA